MSGALLELLRRQIRLEGPLSVAAFMRLALWHPQHGYYRRGDPLGRRGDFVTAPEISQMFGELIGLWLAEAWRLRGRPHPVRLVEAGPGRGTLMADALRATRHVPGFHDALSLHLIEASEPLRRAQAECLGGWRPTWHEDLGSVPAGPTLLVANEFLDALPVRQFQRLGAGWAERCVGLGPAAPDADPPLAFVARPLGPAARFLLPAPDSEAEGAVVERSDDAMLFVRGLARRLATDGGAALLIDYASRGGRFSLQAVMAHLPVDPLAAPGQADLSAHVDFGLLGQLATAAGARVHGPVPQGAFLEALGIARRAERLAAAGAEPGMLAAALDRLTGTDQMGSLFQVLAVSDGADPAPPGFSQPATEAVP